MEINRELFVGSWNVYAEASISQLELQENGKYLHSLWNGLHSHWGAWSIQQDSSFHILRLDLQGAQPETYNGPNGPVPMQWPPFEAWVINQVFPDHAAISVFGGLLVRRSLISPSPTAVQPQQSAMGAATPPHPIPGPIGGPAVVHPQMAIPPRAPAIPMPQPLPVLPLTTTQFPSILKQWADLHTAALQSALQANLDSSNAMHNFAKQFTAYARS